MNSILINDIEQLKSGVEDIISYQDINYLGVDKNDTITVKNGYFF